MQNNKNLATPIGRTWHLLFCKTFGFYSGVIKLGPLVIIFLVGTGLLIALLAFWCKQSHIDIFLGN